MKILPVWETDHYYQKAKKASKSFHPALQDLKDSSKPGMKILEVGCGEGTKLNFIAGKGVKATGVDVSKTAILSARKQYPKHEWIEGDGALLPFGPETFDLVYTAFTLEHVRKPQKTVMEMIRVTKKGGILAFLAPNYGAPNRRSPCFKGNRAEKLFFGLGKDVSSLIFKNKRLDWEKVTPIAGLKEYKIDWDTTVEPYVRSLVDLLTVNQLTIQKASSCWDVPEPNESLINQIIKTLGKKNLYPFRFWGPHLYIVAEKNL